MQAEILFFVQERIGDVRNPQGLYGRTIKAVDFVSLDNQTGVHRESNTRSVGIDVSRATREAHVSSAISSVSEEASWADRLTG